ncbi:MAG: GGDEF domain-containing protein [Abditibacteriales bacterium]|nr:GGDEF domain-containing protein [Abditibacteriales bacterium]MDW8364528.1 GGDEF domain-containing protein [Abditibacteriales bacterium]
MRLRVLVLLAVVGLQVGTAMMHATLGAQDYILSLYYVGIVIAAAGWGHLGGLIGATFSTGVFIVITWQRSVATLSSGLLYALFFYFIALVVGKVADEQQVIRRLTITDSLTGVFNRYHFLRQLQAEVERCQRYGNALSLLLVDVDHLKDINRRWGHQTGDQVLCEVAHVLRSHLRASDTVYRYDGGEFALILPEVRADDAYGVAERLRQIVEERVATSLQLSHPVTIAIGVADTSGSALLTLWETSEMERRALQAGMDQLLERADQALYEAKRAGRNCVRIWRTSSLPSFRAVMGGGKVLPFEPRA